MNVEIHDRMVLDKGANVRKTADGYLTANVRVARTGIQIYRGSELGLNDVEFVRVYRPESTVFDKDSLHSYAHKPVTIDHPPEPVTADNWKKYSVGQVGDEVLKDGEFVRVPMVLMDAQAIKDVEAGKKQLSLGYMTALDFEPGVTEDGQEYDAIQTAIRANHLAVVTAARGGPSLRIGDDQRKKETTKMTDIKMKIVMVDGLPVQLGDDTSATIVERTLKVIGDARDKALADIASLQKQLNDGATALAAAQAELKKTTETKDAEIDVLKKQLADATVTPARLDQLVKDRAEVVGKAKAILGDKLVVDGKTIAEIRKQVVDAKMGDVAKTYSEDAVTAAFTALTVDAKTPVDQLGNALAHQVVDQVGVDVVDKAYDEQDKYLKNAWRNTPVQ